MEKLITLQYSSNAYFLVESLDKIGIQAKVVEQSKLQNTIYDIFVSSTDILRAKELIKELDIDDSPVDSDSVGYLEGYQEWSEKMYDPGYYTGGKTPHYLKDKSNWKFIIPYLLLGGFLLMYQLIVNGIESFDFGTFLFAGLYIFAGISMTRQLKKKRK